MKRSLTSLAALALFASAAAAQFQFAATSDISLFEDISVTGGLAIAGATDDSEHNITTTIGNALFPAGPVRIGNNGAAVWGITTGDVGFTNATLPTTGLPTGMPAGGAGYLLPFWDDLYPQNGATTLYWKEDVPNGELTIMWINENHCCTANNNVITFELKVYASGPVYARFIYLDTRHSIPPASSINDFGQSATVGYLRGSSVVAPSNLMYSFNAGVIFDGLVVDLVDPPFNVAAAAAPSGVASGGVVKLTASVTGGFSSPLSVTADTTALGGAPGTTLFDDGTNGDVVSGDGTYSRDVLVTTTALGVRWIPVYVVDASPYQLNALIQVSVAPPNDECFAAALVNFGTNGPFSNEGATTSLPVDTGAGCTVSLGTNDVWFVYFSACTGPTTVATGCTGYDTVLGVYDNCGGTLLACNDNATGCGTGGSSATFTASAGGLYFIRVAAKTAGTFGTFNVNVSTGAYTFAFSSPLGAGSIQANVSNGTPFGAYIMALTLAPGVFPNGWLGGLDIPFGDFIAQATAGFPFTGGLDACGGAQIGPFPGLPSGLQLWGTSIDMPTLFGAVNKIAPAVTHVIP